MNTGKYVFPPQNQPLSTINALAPDVASMLQKSK